MRRVAGDQKKYSLEEKKNFLAQSIDELKFAISLAQANSTDLAAVCNNLGLSYFENDQFAEAVAQYAQAITKEDAGRHQELSFYYKNKGLEHYHIGEMDAALTDYDKAIELNENNADNYFNRGNVYLYQAG